MKAINKYQLPVDESNIVAIYTQESPAHQEDPRLKYAIDFLFAPKGKYKPTGLPVYAAANGIVWQVVDESIEGGPHHPHTDPGNYIVLEHPNGEYSHYAHLQYRGIQVSKGDKVKAGQQIAKSGNTGYTLASHLHFSVFRFTGDTPDKFETLEVSFEELKEKAAR